MSIVTASVLNILDGAERLRSFFNTLNDELNDKSLLDHPLQTVAAICRQKERATKRAIFDDGFHSATAAINNFLSVNTLCSDVDIRLSSDVVNNARDYISLALEHYTAKFAETPGDFDLCHLLSLWRYGPGSSVGTTFTHFADKIQQEEVTVTVKALPYARIMRSMNPHLNRFDASLGTRFKYKVVRGSSTSTVPKNETTDRTVSTEPIMNMALQLAAGAYIEGALRCCGIDISVQQSYNKTLAYIGSVTDNLATIDLKNASDMISMALIELLWPASWFHFLSDIRSCETKICVDGESKWVGLNMMSTMGNGFTFPMMTLTLLALVYAVQSTPSSKRGFVDYSKVAVFGDDIIVPKCDYHNACSTLADAGLIVNYDKSFSEGPFRESCGGDYWHGYDITPFYIETLYSDPEVYLAINKIHAWCANINIYMPKTISLLISFIDSQEPFLVPYWEAPTSGIYSGEVKRRYKKWVINRTVKVDDSRRIDENIFPLLYSSGCIRSVPRDNFKVCYSPRQEKVIDKLTNLPIPPPGKWVLKLSKMPQGILDGYDRHSIDHKTIEGLQYHFDSLVWESKLV